MLTSLPSGGPDEVPVTTPPGTLFISGTSGIEITIKAAEATVIGVPYYWQDDVWQPLLGDATVAPRQVKAVATGVDIGHLYFNKPATPLWFVVLETGGGTVSFCDIREAEGAHVLGQQDVTGASGGGGGGDATAANQVIGNASLASIDGKLTAPLSITGPLTDTQLRASAVSVTGPLTDAQLRATPVPVSGTVTANIGTTGGLSLEATQLNVKAQQTDGTQRSRITDGTNNAAVSNAAPTGTEYGLGVRPIVTRASTSSVTSPTVTTVFASILAANSSAKLRIFYNASAVSVGLTLGGSGAVSPGFVLAPGQTWVMPQGPDGIAVWTGIVNATVAVGTTSINVTEIT